MAKSGYSYKESKKLISGIQAQEKKLYSLSSESTKLEKEIEDLAYKYRESEAIAKLKSTPVEELADLKLGIRTSLLRQNGFSNIYQLSSASPERLEKINGISRKSALLIISESKKIVESTISNTPLRISSASGSRTAEKLVSDLYIYQQQKKISEDATELYNSSHDNIAKLVRQSKPSAGRLSWAFATTEKREASQQSLKAIEAMLNEGYGVRVESALLESKKALKATHDEIWKSFSSNSASFYAAYESIKNKKSGSRSNELKKAEQTAIKNGLPEELAVAVGNVELNLTGLKAELRPYQEYGVKYILRQGAVLLGDDMGLGKTIEAIAAMVCMRNSGSTHFIVVCPASVLTNWMREIAKFCDITPTKIHGPECNNQFSGWASTGGIAVTTYETLSKLEYPDDFSFSMLIVDEAHYVKNPKANRTVSLLNLRAKTSRVLFMTGTALENTVEEMCFLIGCLQPDVASQIKGSTSLLMAADFRKKVSGVYFRRVKEDVLDELPEKTESDEWVELTDADKAAYGIKVREGNFMGMRQVSWDIDDITQSSKADRLRDICEEAIGQGRKVIVFSFFRNTISRVGELIGQNCFGPISGDIPPEKRQKIVDDFSAADGGAVLISQIGAGGTGMNIQAASVIIICEPQLKPSIENQAIARAYRMGQSRNVLVYRLLCEDTVDEQIMQLLEAKRKLFDEFADKSESGDQSLLEIQSDDIGSMIKKEQERPEYSSNT